jgi:hypothetical protein
MNTTEMCTHRRGRWGALRELGLVAAALAVYMAVRASTRSDPEAAEAHAREVLAFERTMRFDWESGAQHLILRTSVLVRGFDFVYVWTFWPTVATTLVVLYRTDRSRYVLLRNALFISGALGLMVFAAFPVAPPRFLAGFTDTVMLARQDHLAHPSAITNQYAAMPSFHVGWTVLAGACLVPLVARPVVRVVALVPGVLMVFAVVFTANHFVLDAVAGIAASFVGLAIAHRIRLVASSMAATPKRGDGRGGDGSPPTSARAAMWGCRRTG